MEAITEGNARLGQARAAAAARHDAEKARQMAEQAEIFSDCLRQMDDALRVIVEKSRLAESTLTIMGMLGESAPNNAQFTSLGERVINASLMFTPFARAYRHLAPGERHTWASLLEAWMPRIAAEVERRLAGEKQREDA
jgi:hypothetical protein